MHEKALKILCENANLSAKNVLVLCGRVSTLKKVKKLEKGVVGHAQIERVRLDIFPTRPEYYSSGCVCNQRNLAGYFSCPTLIFRFSSDLSAPTARSVS